MNAVGLAMFPCALAGIALTGLPAFVVLIAVALAAAAAGIATGQFDARLLQALPSRLVGLLEHDLLQALALYALVGALLHRLALAQVWLKTVARWLGFTGVGESLAAIGLGALTAPMNGSVGASLAMQLRSAAPRLRAGGHAAESTIALTAVASTLGVIVPPSLVLLLLGDAMMRAHTEALSISGVAMRVVNNQDIVRAALWPAAWVLLLSLGCTAFAARPRRSGARAPRESVGRGDAAMTLGLTFAVGAMLGAVAMGWAYAVETAAAAGVALLAWGAASGRLRGVWRAVLDDAMTLTGMVFALLVGATTFTLVLRGLGTDAWLAAALRASTVGPTVAVLGVMALVLACAFVLDAFEIIFLVVPIVMPPLLARVSDAAWVGALTLLVLQLGYLLPPIGYAVLMARAAEPRPASGRALAKALAPYLVSIGTVLAAVLYWPALTHPVADSPAPPAVDVDDLLRQLGRPREGSAR